MAVYDQAIRNECGYTGPLPFWDWSFDSEAPENAEIWDRFGTTGCISNLPGFSASNAAFPESHCLTRDISFEGALSFYSSEQIVFNLEQTMMNLDKALKKVHIMVYMVRLVGIWEVLF